MIMRKHSLFYIETYGCQMNIAESHALEMSLIEHGIHKAEKPEDADCVIINTCSVRKTAENRIWGRIGFYKHLKEEKDLTLIITGCMAERLHDEIIEMAPAVDHVIGTNDKYRIAAILTGASDERREEYTFTHNYHKEGDVSSFIPIMNGCNNYCSYCIVPYVRGREISRSVESIVDEVKRLNELGVKEITLLGQNVNSYNYTYHGIHYQFPDILEKVVNEAIGVKWIRFESPHPKDFSPQLISLISQEDKLPHHLHIPLQSGSTKILTSMRRKYSRESYLSLINDISTAIPDMTYTTDVMVGFPGEEEEDFLETLSLINEVKFIEAFMYYFNPREGTKAVTMENQVPIATRLERLNRLIDNQRNLTKKHKQERCFDELELLVEGMAKKNKSQGLGRSEHNEMIVFNPIGELNKGDIVRVKLSGLEGNTFKGNQIK